MIPRLRDASNHLLLTDVEKAEEIGKAFNSAHSTTFNDYSDTTTEAAVKGSSLIVHFLSPDRSARV